MQQEPVRKRTRLLPYYDRGIPFRHPYLSDLLSHEHKKKEGKVRHDWIMEQLLLKKV